MIGRSTTVARMFASSAADAPVLLGRSGAVQNVVLNRPKALNALNLDQIKILTPEVQEWNASDAIAAVLMKGSGEKAFCAGGDIVALHGGSQREQEDFFKQEYILDYLLAKMKPTQICLWNGIVMGGGVGVSINAPYRIATEKTMFAMPETGIGFFPDVGGSYFLPRLADNIGMYLALTGDRVKGHAAVATGIATHFVESEKIPALEEELQSVKTRESSEIDGILAKYTSDINSLPATAFDKNRDSIRSCFGHSTVEEVVSAVDELAKSGDEWAAKLLAMLQSRSPTSMKVTHEQVVRGGKATLEECFQMEARLAMNFIRDHDFFEGVRALLIDKDNKPVWAPKTLEEIPRETVERYFIMPDGVDELTLPTVE